MDEDYESNSNSLTFFEAIRNSNVGEVVKIFRKEKENPWEFKEQDSGFNGIHLIFIYRAA